MKTCTKCNKRKLLTEFYKDAQKSSGFRPDCKSCVNLKSKAWSRANPEKRRSIMRKYIYGISEKEYQKLFKQQKGVCKICKRRDSRRLGVDHSHKTGKIRGLLCQKCNAGLGMFLDSVRTLKSAIKYLGGYV